MSHAAAAMERIMARLDGDGARLQVSLQDIERAEMETRALAATVLSLRSFGDTAKATLKALEIAARAEDSLRREQVIQYQPQIDGAVEQADKARKAGVIGVVFDWIIAAVE
ncbi:MAG: type III secretion system translocon subunit SctE, partial [Microvirgula sp.]